MADEGQSARFLIETYGCRVNQADAEGIRARLEEAQLSATDTARDADVVVLHSCTVTHKSDADLRKAVHRAKRENPGARVVVSGCYAQRDPGAVAALPGADAVVGHARPTDVAEVALGLLGAASPQAAPGRAPAPVIIRRELSKAEPEDLPPVEPVAVTHDRTRPFVKIQDGCDARCTYCVIPAVRGAARSAPPDRVRRAVERLIADGALEVVIAGVHLGTYGQRLSPPSSLAALVESLLELPGLGRLRLSCIEPMAFPMSLAERAAADPRLAPHFHLPLQSGSDTILKRMARPYRGADFVEVLREIRRLVPRACLATDVIVGFPGETEEDFLDTLRVVESAELDYVHVFSYSDRPGVPSTRLPRKIGSQAIKDRARRLIELSSARHARFLERQVGTRLSALSLEQPGSLETTAALSDNYAKVTLDAPVAPNTELWVEITGRGGDGLLGRVQGPLHATPERRAL